MRKVSAFYRPKGPGRVCCLVCGAVISSNALARSGHERGTQHGLALAARMKKPETTMEKSDKPTLCFLCSTAIPEAEKEDYLCHGCHKYICEECSVNSILMGPHKPEDHLVDDPSNDDGEW